MTLRTVAINAWQDEFRSIITDPAVLIERLQLDPCWLPAAVAASQLFGLKVPEAYLSRIAPNTPDDPLLMQVLPLAAELDDKAGFNSDPVGEQGLGNAIPGMIQKYRGRALLMVNEQCVIHCRYCFRRHFPYEDHRLNRGQWQRVIDAIKDDSTITEIIYSGGDPLSASDASLQWLTDKLGEIDHLKRLRIHTRLPIMVPSRITHDCLQALTHPRLKTIMVIHCNHSNEIDHHVSHSLSNIAQASITLLNQSVLLKGVNNDSQQLCKLSETLFDNGVLPYYLHTLDPVSGASHFDLHPQDIQTLYQEMQKNLPGYLLPKLVREEAGKPSKTIIAF